MHPLSPATRVWLGIVAIIILHTFVMLFDLNFMPSEQAEPRDATLLGKLRHRLLHTRLLRRVRFAFFETMFTMVGAESGRNSRRTRSRSSPTRQRLLKLIAVLMGLFLTLVYESVRRKELRGRADLDFAARGVHLAGRVPRGDLPLTFESFVSLLLCSVRTGARCATVS